MNRLAIGLCLMCAVRAAADEPPPPKRVEVKELTPPVTDNKNRLLAKFKGKLTMSASSVWGGWPAENAIDGVLTTSWFTERGDAAAFKKKPWVQVEFPEDVTVARVTILGNRDPAWLNGYTILAGGVELLDKDGKRLHYEDNEGVGNFRDFEFKFEKAKAGVRAVRFYSLGDQGDQNPYDDIAIAEILID